MKVVSPPAVPTREALPVRIRHAILLLGVPLLLAAGCQGDDEITVTTIKHPEREQLRLLAAIAPREGMVWVFRLSGPAAEVDEVKKAFDGFVASVRFSDDKGPPTWQLPAGWKEERGNDKRYATLRIPA